MEDVADGFQPTRSWMRRRIERDWDVSGNRFETPDLIVS